MCGRDVLNIFDVVSVARAKRKSNPPVFPFSPCTPSSKIRTTRGLGCSIVDVRVFKSLLVCSLPLFNCAIRRLKAPREWNKPSQSARWSLRRHLPRSCSPRKGLFSAAMDSGLRPFKREGAGGSFF